MSHARTVQWQRGVAYALAAGILWPVVEIIGSVISRAHPPLQTVWLRYAAHLSVLVALTAPRMGTGMFRTNHLRLQLLRGALMFLMPLSMVLGARAAPVSAIWAVFWSAPVLVLVAAPLIGERPGRGLWTATFIGFAGAMLARGSSDALGVAVLPGMLMAVSLAGYVLLTRRLRSESLATSLFYTGVGAIVPLSLLIPWLWRPVQTGDLVVVVMLGCASLLALACIDRAADALNASILAPLLYAVVLFETPLAVLHADAAPALSAILGLVAVCMTLVATVIHTARAHRLDAAERTSLERGVA